MFSTPSSTGDGGPGGGSGQSGLFAAQIRRHYDLIAVQPRGLSWSTPLDCREALDRSEGLPGSLATVARAVQTAGDLYRACEEADSGYVSTMTTETVARDLEEVRTALGEPELNLYGVSYGGVLMATYASLYPERTGRVILDSPVAPEDRWFGLGDRRRDERRGIVRDFFAWVAARDDVYGAGTTPLQVYRVWLAAVRREADRTGLIIPPAITTADLPGDGGGSGDAEAGLLDGLNAVSWRLGTLGDALLSYVTGAFPESTSENLVLGDAVYSDRNWGAVASFITAVPEPGGNPVGHGGLGGTAATGAEPVSPSLTAEAPGARLFGSFVERAIVCNENAVPPRVDIIARAVGNVYFGGDVIETQADELASGLFCLGWPEPGPAVRLNGELLRRSPLVLGFERDGAVSSSGSVRMAEAVNGRLITVPGIGHGVLPSVPATVEAAMVDYMIY
ncbi:alpha/beta hydrolase [Corynebacterium bovis]|uniref:alpha/beta hydrolase n=1 Tax=Corynebacterium bovis TaxID=36808 RepID=UPI00244D1629|nr:alpha/beta hydrolase [Corynebacterium bovis]MDH2456423.1 alpha/beta hydrolase [Corynebacterium bovis]